jgi:predicted ester cyclase
MDPSEMKATVRKWLTGIFDEGNFDLVDEMTAEGYAFHIARPGMIKREVFVETIAASRAAYTGINNTFEEQIAEGNVVVSRGTTRATHTGMLGDLEPTGKTVAVPWVIFTRFEGDRIIEDRELWDELGLMYQLGAIPEPE